VELSECLKLAEEAHPDMIIQKKAMEAANMGAKAARSYYWPQLDINGSYGKSGGAFKGEKLNLMEDWQAGARMTLYFGGTSFGLSGLRQKTSPKLGQSSRTEIETVSSSVGLLDSFKNRSERKEAALTFHQAETQLKRTKMEVLNHVREAFAGYKKSVLQVRTAENDLALAKTEYSIAGIKDKYKEASIPEKAIARNKLAQAEAGLAEAQAHYAIAIAALNRAVGVADKFK
jgi:outer membrane protein TolC